MSELVEHSFKKLEKYCDKEQYMGYDPYDGLNSVLFKSLPFLQKNRLARLAWIQFFKRSPLNLRPVTGVKKEYNPKALGLFLSGYCNLYKIDPKTEYLNKIYLFIEKNKRIKK